MEIIELNISPTTKQHFNVIVTRSPVGEAVTNKPSKLPFLKKKIDHRVTVLKALGANTFEPKNFPEEELNWMISAGLLTEDLSSFHPNLQKNIGKELYQALFPPKSDVEMALQKAITLVESRQNPTQLHIQLVFAANVVQHSRLTDYPWELVYDGKKFLAQKQVTFSRYIAYNTPPPNLPSVGQINVLLVSSSAGDPENGLKPLSNNERQAIRKGLEKAKREGHICLTELEKPTFNNLRAYLTEHQGEKTTHVLHFDGHGFFGCRCQNKQCQKMNKSVVKNTKCKSCGRLLPNPEGHLIFEDDAGKPHYVSAEELGLLLEQASFGNSIGQNRGITLAVLSACNSARSVAGDSVFDGVAQNLINCRIPAVVAMQYLVSVDSATSFAEQFYRSLGQRNPLATAVSQGREAMDFKSNQWYRPVLYLRWKDNEGGQLFALPQAQELQNIKQVSQEVSKQLDYASSAQQSVVMSRLAENSSKRTFYRKQAEKWLGDKNCRLYLASILAESILEGTYLDIYKVRLLQEDKDNFIWNLYNCLNWLLDAFQSAKGQNTDQLKENLIDHSLEPYVKALDLLKKNAEKDFHDNQEIIETIHRYIDNLIARILS